LFLVKEWIKGCANEPQRRGDAEFRGELEFISRKDRQAGREEREGIGDLGNREWGMYGKI